MQGKILKTNTYRVFAMREFIKWAKHQEDLDYEEYDQLGITEDLGSQYTGVIEAARAYMRSIGGELEQSKEPLTIGGNELFIEYMTIPEDVSRHEGLSASSKLLYGTLLYRANLKPYTDAINERLAEDNAISKRTVSTSLNQLEELGLIKRQEVRYKHDKTIYRRIFLKHKTNLFNVPAFAWLDERVIYAE